MDDHLVTEGLGAASLQHQGPGGIWLKARGCHTSRLRSRKLNLLSLYDDLSAASELPLCSHRCFWWSRSMKKRLNVNVICYLCVFKSSALPHSTRKRTATVNPKLQIILCFLSDHQVIVISVSFSLGAHLRPRQSGVPQLSALRGRYGTRFERWWPHYYNLMVYVSEEVMFLSRSPSQQKAVCCSYLARPAAGTNLQCIKQATTHTQTHKHGVYTEPRVCVRL